jgi:type II secretory pathway component PulJ
MKTFWTIRFQRARHLTAGSTLVEMMFATGIFTLVMGSVLILYIFSARATSAVSRQLEINNGARVVNFMAKEIKSAQSVAVQNYDGSSFSGISAGSAQQGNALALTIPSGTNTLQVWYWRNSSGRLYRATLNTGRSKLFLSNVTNTIPFALKTYNGGVISNLTGRILVDINLFVLDSNVKDFRQTLNLRTAAEQRNN